LSNEYGSRKEKVVSGTPAGEPLEEKKKNPNAINSNSNYLTKHHSNYLTKHHSTYFHPNFTISPNHLPVQA
jgi:hypothetical protein